MGIFSKMRQGLKKTRDSIFKQVKKLLKFEKLDEETLEDIEELLITSDMGVETASKVIEQLREKARDYENPTEALKDILKDLLKIDYVKPVVERPPLVISIVGVNGTGKTTTIGKLAKRFAEEGNRVVLAACDTFRAAAVEQLRIWSERIGVDFISQGQGADPAAVAFDAVSHAKSKLKDLVIIDTAGRLHTKHNLMEELKKIHRVVKKVIPEAPHEVLLVIDATTGQNGLIQARKFMDAVEVTGIVLTKLDGTAKGGIVFAIVKELGIPVKYIGIGEGMDDLKPFDAIQFVEALLGTEELEENEV